jgi:hypothetical protein
MKVFVLANSSPTRLFVRWYPSFSEAASLFDAAVSSANREEDVALFEMAVAAPLDHRAIREQAESLVRSGAYEPLRRFEAEIKHPEASPSLRL